MSFKIVISGVTGRIGAHVLHHALRNPLVSTVIALSRRPPPGIETHAKLEVVLLEDFTKYPDDVLAKLSGADGCIWCMTTTAGNPVLELEYPKAFAEAFASTMPVGAKPFRYLHLSGGMVERDQDRSLWMKGSMRKTKGRGEVQMVDFAMTHENWITIVARPGMVVQRGSIIGEASMMVAGSSGSFIRYDELALALINAVMHGSEELLLPAALVQQGQQLVQGVGKEPTRSRTHLVKMEGRHGGEDMSDSIRSTSWQRRRGAKPSPSAEPLDMFRNKFQYPVRSVYAPDR